MGIFLAGDVVGGGQRIWALDCTSISLSTQAQLAKSAPLIWHHASRGDGVTLYKDNLAPSPLELR